MHTSNLVGKIANTSAALSHSFVGYVASLVSRSAQWRGNFARRAGTPPLSKSNVRWYSEFKLARQVFQHLGLIEELARDDEAGGDEIRKNLLNILDRLPNENYLSGALELKLELAMLIDAVQPLVILCYNNEGDTALKCATAFDEWMVTLDHLQKASGQDGSQPLLPNVREIAAFA